MSNLKIVLEELPPREDLACLWRAFDRLGTHDFFVTWTWLGSWLEALPSSIRPKLLKVIKGEALVGLALLTLIRGKFHGLMPISRAYLNATGDQELDNVMIEHNGFASMHSTSGEFLQALVAAFAAGDIHVDELVLPGIEAMPGEAGLIDSGHVMPAFRTRLSGMHPSEGIAPLLSSNARQQLRRSLRAAQRVGPIAVHFAQDHETALQFFTGLKALHIRWWERRGQRHAFSNTFFEKFHHTLIANGIRDHNVDLLRVSAGDQLLGYLYNFRRNGKISSYQTGFDETVLGIRPGYVCHSVAMSHYANAGMSSYDFLAGDNRLKHSFGTERYELRWQRFRRRTPIFRIEAAVREMRKGLRRLQPH